jgi:mycoredoxin
MENGQIKLYGTSWCGDTRRTREYLEINEIPFQWIDIDEDEAAAEIVKQINNGYKSVPTIIFPDGSTLTEPSLFVLKEKLANFNK